jgi:uncharacterized protein (TIGR03382 family)
MWMTVVIKSLGLLASGAAVVVLLGKIATAASIPPAAALFVGGLIGLGFLGRRRRSKSTTFGNVSVSAMLHD